MKKVLLLTTFFLSTPLLLIFSILFFLFIDYHNEYGSLFALGRGENYVAYAAIPTAENVFEEEIEAEDARSESIRQFFSKYQSPLEPYANLIVQTADKYHFDHRLLPAIAMQESNVCKKIIENSYNCWGFGIYGSKVTTFENYPQAIDAVSKTLAKRYIQTGLDTPDEIMKKYTPSSNGSWADGVTHFMNQLYTL